MAGATTAGASVVEAVVASGRTVVGANGKKFGPGETVRVSDAEVGMLTELGFLVDADALVKKQNGPHISVNGGPTVRIA